MSNIETIDKYLKGERPIIQVGYDGKKEQVTRKVGEMWKDGMSRGAHEVQCVGQKDVL